MTGADSARFVVECRECETRTATDAANEVIEYYRRHHGVTGHEIEWVRTGEASVEAGDLTGVVREFDDQYENGVPIGVIAAAMGERGEAVGETLATIHAARMTGGLWEPHDDHLRAY